MEDDSVTVLVDVDELSEMIAALPDPTKESYSQLTLGHVSISVSPHLRGRNVGDHAYEIVCKGVVLHRFFTGGPREAAQIVNVAAAAADRIQTGATALGVRSLIQRYGYDEAIRLMRGYDAVATLMRERGVAFSD